MHTTETIRVWLFLLLVTISAIVAPHLKYELMFIPIGIPGRVLWGLFCAWDIHGAIQQSRQVDPSQGGGINHRGHLSELPLSSSSSFLYPSDHPIGPISGRLGAKQTQVGLSWS